MEQNAERALLFVCDEIDKIVDMGELNKDTLMCLKELADIKKDLLTAMSMEEQLYGGSGASEGYRSMAGEASYNSYARGRDSMGRYTSSRSYAGNRGNSYRQSYGDDHAMTVLQQHMNNANSEEERATIRRIMDSM